MHINRTKVLQAAAFTSFFLLATMSSLIKGLLGIGSIMFLLIVAIIIFIFFSYPKYRSVIRVKIPLYYKFWLFFSVFVALGFTSNIVATIRMILCIMLGILLQYDTKWIDRAMKCMFAVTGIFVFFTIFFYVFPGLYHFVPKLYGFIPPGTNLGAEGYHAGIASHYSQNAIYICFFLIAAAVFPISQQTINPSNKISKTVVIAIFIASFALLMTTKRGPLLAAAFAICVVYINSNRDKYFKMIKFAIIVLVGLIAFFILSKYVPVFASVVERFQSAGEDDSTIERYKMWGLAIKHFEDKPIFGNGFWSFRVFFNNELAASYARENELLQALDAHNAYIQVLCETGIVGELLYLLAVGLLFKKAIELSLMLRRCRILTYYYYVQVSLAIQTFYIFYSITGNCLHDTVFMFYSLSLAMIMAIDRACTKNPKLLTMGASGMKVNGLRYCR